MLIVSIQVLPFGEEAKRETLHTLTIANIGPTICINGAADAHDYSVVAGEHQFILRAHPKSDGALELVRRAVESLRAMGAR